jgi:uncharacterized membrane protein
MVGVGVDRFALPAALGLKCTPREVVMSNQEGMTGHDHVRRFHMPYKHLDSVFGSDWFGLKAEAFARFFGTPTFLIAQTFIVAIWIWINAVGWTQFDVYPFILLNLAFSTQAAYAAPLILLAQTRQADRDKANSIADAQHREELHQVNEQRQKQMQEQSGLMIEMLGQNTTLTESVQTLLKQNTELTESVRVLVERIEAMTAEVHSQVAHSGR